MGPLVLVEHLVELGHVPGVSHVDEGLPHVRLGILVDGHLEEVLAAQKLLVHLVQQNGLRQPVRDVAHHQCSPGVVQRVLHVYHARTFLGRLLILIVGV